MSRDHEPGRVATFFPIKGYIPTVFIDKHGLQPRVYQVVTFDCDTVVVVIFCCLQKHDNFTRKRGIVLL